MKHAIAWLKRLFHRDSAWQEEIESHLAMRADWHQAQGIAPDAARNRAARDFGSRLRTLEAVRAVHRAPWLDALAQDARHGLRVIRRSPAFSLAAVATLAVGIGASTAVFSVVDLLLFRSLPYPRAERLVSVGFSGPIDTNEFNVGNAYLDWRDHQRVFAAMTSMYPGGECDLGEAPALRVPCVQVEANFLATLGIVPAAGRDFHAEDDRPGAPKVALLSYATWQSRFGGDPGAAGKTILLDDAPVRVIGFLPRTFEMPQLGEADVLLAEQLDEGVARAPRSTVFLRTFARLKDGATAETARQQLLPLFSDSVQRYVPPPLRREVGLVVRSLRDRQIHDVKLASWLLFGAVLALVALACANVANLMLARAAARWKELAMRAALGAGRGRLARQMFTESLLLSLAGGAAGCVFAWGLLRAVVATAPQTLPRLLQARLDARVLLFALAVSLAAAVAAGLLPAWERLSAAALAGWHSTGGGRLWARPALVATQVAISLVLLTGASLLVRSLWKLESESLGFQPRRVVTAAFTLNRHRYNSAEKQNAFYAEVERQLARIPGVSRFALSDTIPPSGGMRGRPFSNMRIAGHLPLPEQGGMVAFRYVTPGYFRALGIPILAGRDFDEKERSGTETPLILSQSLAQRMFPAENPLGQQIDLDVNGHWLPVVGVAGDVKNSGLTDAPQPEYYRLRMYRSDALGLSGVALLQTPLDAGALERWVRRQMAAIDPALPVSIETIETKVERLSQRARFLAALIALFAAFGLLLAAIGLYGVLSFLVAQRTREIGVRIALGATPGQIARMAVHQAGLWTLAGMAAGWAASAALGRIARGALFQVSPFDPLSLAAAALVLAMAAALAAWRPARRAAQVDPAVSLREE
ncbi:MAG TPA: ABC transporter permease [Bryobacteraceae bacterium]